MTYPALQVQALCAGHGRRQVLSRIDLQIAHGEWLAVVGANGSGKSTLLDCISGRHEPQSGRIRISGHCLHDAALAAKGRLGYAVAAEALPDVLTGGQCLAIHARAKHCEVDEDLLQLATQLRLEARLDEPVALYSYGTRQKLGALLALLGDPSLIILDESFNGLDPASSLALKRHLRQRVDAGRCGIILATHALDIVERWCDRALQLDEGRFVAHWDRIALRALAAGDGLEAAMAGLVPVDSSLAHGRI